MRRLLVFVLLGCGGGCVTASPQTQPRASMKLSHNQEAMKEEVMKHLSIGMPIEEAAQIMKDNGFKVGNGSPHDEPHLSCYAVYHDWSLTFGTKEINISLFHETGKLTRVQVQCYICSL